MTTPALYRRRNISSRSISPLAALQAHPRFAAKSRALAGFGCACEDEKLGALGASFLTKVLRSATPGPNDFKLKSTPKEVKKVIAVAGPALSAIPGWGTLAAAGATVITAADQKLKAQRVMQAGSGASLINEYSSMAGTVPGRVFGVDNMEKVIDAIGITGGWPNVKKWQSAVVDQVIRTGCKGCTPPTMQDWVKSKVSAGQLNPLALAPEWTSLVNSTWGSKWFVTSAGEVQNQAIIDMIDALIASVDPNAPLYYAQPQTEQPASVTPGNPPTTQTPVTQTPVTQTPISTLPAPPTSVTDPNLNAYIQALIGQGKSQQDAFTAALAALGNAGTPITPQVQQQVADSVQTASSSLPSWAIPAGIAAGGLILFLAMRKRGHRR